MDFHIAYPVFHKEVKRKELMHCKRVLDCSAPFLSFCVPFLGT